MSSLKGCITNTIERNWNSEKQGEVEEIVGKLEKSGSKVEEEINKDSALENKTTQDCHLFLQPIKRLESHLLFREESQE